jgi:hypothetical protein
MHCPSCGTQQISHETKFCSRCGMPLSVITEVLNNGGYLPQLAELSQQKESIFTRRNGLGFSAVWLLFFLLLAAIGGGVFENEYFGATSAIIATFGAFIIFISSLIFLRPAPKRSNLGPDRIAELSGPRTHGVLPPQQTAPADVYPRRADWRGTNDLQSTPTSVTDSTTRLLEKDR